MWLDDERNPKSEYIQLHYGSKPDDIWIKNVREAKELILSNEVTSMSLDHDLSDYEDGYDFTKWLEEQCYKGRLDLDWEPDKLCVHSDNSIGAKYMRMCLLNCVKYSKLNKKEKDLK